MHHITQPYKPKITVELNGEKSQQSLAEVYEQVLRRNTRLVGAHFAIGVEDALFLRGELPLSSLCEAELDRVVGSLYAYVEQSFPALIRLGFARRFAALEAALEAEGAAADQS